MFLEIFIKQRKRNGGRICGLDARSVTFLACVYIYIRAFNLMQISIQGQFKVTAHQITNGTITIEEAIRCTAVSSHIWTEDREAHPMMSWNDQFMRPQQLGAPQRHSILSPPSVNW